MKKGILLLCVLLTLPLVIAAGIELSPTDTVPSVELQPPVALGPSGSGNSSSGVNESIGNSLWWRLDGSNDPPTADWNMETKNLLFNSSNTGEAQILGVTSFVEFRDQNILNAGSISALNILGYGNAINAVNTGGFITANIIGGSNFWYENIFDVGDAQYTGNIFGSYNTLNNTNYDVGPLIVGNGLFLNSTHYEQGSVVVGEGDTAGANYAYTNWRSTGIFDVGNVFVIGNTNVSGNVTAQYFKGNGTQLSGICLANGTNCAASSSSLTNATYISNFYGNDMLYLNGSVGGVSSQYVGQQNGFVFLVYPRKSAFRGGNFTSNSLNDSNIGNYSFAWNGLASGVNNIAIGACNATGTSSSTCIGNGGVSSGSNSVSLGAARATGTQAICGGATTARCTASNAVGFGSQINASGIQSFASGVSLDIAGTRCVGFGQGGFCDSTSSNSFGQGLLWNLINSPQSRIFGSGTIHDSSSTLLIGGGIINGTPNSAFIGDSWYSKGGTNTYGLGFGGNTTCDYCFLFNIDGSTVPGEVTLFQNDTMALWGDPSRPLKVGIQTRTPRTTVEVNGTTSTQKLAMSNSTNTGMDRCTLVSGACTISNTQVTVNTNIFCFEQSQGGTIGSIGISARTSGTNYTVTSSNVLDTSIVACMLVEPYGG